MEAALDQTVSDAFTIAPPGVLYHYASWEAAENILTRQEFWATSFDCTNDRDELVAADPVIINVAERLLESATGSVRVVLAQFIEHFQRFHVTHAMPVYLSCFSTERDDRHFWCSAYAQHGEGVCLGLRVLTEKGPPPIQGGSLLKVEYAEVSLRRKLEGSFNRVCSIIARADETPENCAQALSALYRISAFASISTKHQEWAIEREYRVVTLIADADHQPEERNAGNRVIRYWPIRLRAENKSISLVEVIVGPNQDADRGRERAQEILRAAGYVEGPPEYPESILASAVAPCN
jgi:hypothetical protein